MAVRSKVNGDSAGKGDSDTTSGASSSDENYPEFIRAKSEEYAKRIAKLQEEYLMPLKEDLADWLNAVLGKSFCPLHLNVAERLDDIGCASCASTCLPFYCYFAVSARP